MLLVVLSRMSNTADVVSTQSADPLFGWFGLTVAHVVQDLRHGGQVSVVGRGILANFKVLHSFHVHTMCTTRLAHRIEASNIDHVRYNPVVAVKAVHQTTPHDFSTGDPLGAIQNTGHAN